MIDVDIYAGGRCVEVWTPSDPFTVEEFIAGVEGRHLAACERLGIEPDTAQDPSDPELLAMYRETLDLYVVRGDLAIGGDGRYAPTPSRMVARRR